MRFRITVRGDHTELRGWLDGHNTDLNGFASFMEPYGVVIASPATDDWNPWPISEPSNPPTIEKSREVIIGMADEAVDAHHFVDQMSGLHYSQALVIRGERGRAEQAEQIIERVREELSNPFGESAERSAGVLAFLAKSLERIADIVGLPREDRDTPPTPS